MSDLSKVSTDDMLAEFYRRETARRVAAKLGHAVSDEPGVLFYVPKNAVSISTLTGVNLNKANCVIHHGTKIEVRFGEGRKVLWDFDTYNDARAEFNKLIGEEI